MTQTASWWSNFVQVTSRPFLVRQISFFIFSHFPPNSTCVFFVHTSSSQPSHPRCGHADVIFVRNHNSPLGCSCLRRFFTKDRSCSEWSFNLLVAHATFFKAIIITIVQTDEKQKQNHRKDNSQNRNSGLLHFCAFLFDEFCYFSKVSILSLVRSNCVCCAS